MIKNLDFEKQREAMVNEQLISRGITNKRVLAAFRKVPRDKFVPEEYINEAYADFPIPIGSGQTISQPFMVALMTELLELKAQDKVLEVGTGSGYQTAILAQLCAQVYTIDRVELLAHQAKKLLGELGYENIEVVSGDGSCGLEEHAPYNGIIVTCGAPSIPEPLKEQLAEGGNLVAPVGGNFSQVLTVVKKKATGFKVEENCSCIFVPLIGKYGWQKDA
ncbi:MAG: protein-L-isoaspartate(D-aspartate) O-methyltransferase [Candidatus Omnitrophica bacterium]|nr:protein-L-isoaspartate(D-aspartate) O-methyltransferase [Candidatus Omnitrophota bacterium]